MKLEYKEMSMYEVLDLMQKNEPITLNELVSRGATEWAVYRALCKEWIEKCGNGKGMNEAYQLTEIGYRVRGI